MPPKVKFTREEMITAALEITREKGIEAVTARSLGERLGTSSRPIFTAFQNMEEVQREVIAAGKKRYNQYIQEGLAQPSAFKGVGTQYIKFAMGEPKLFQLLFMTEQAEVPELKSVLPLIDENYWQILKSVQKDYGLEETEAESFYQLLWIFTHGIATLCATKMCRFSSGEIGKMMAQVREGLLKELKAGESDD